MLSRCTTFIIIGAGCYFVVKSGVSVFETKIHIEKINIKNLDHFFNEGHYEHFDDLLFSSSKNFSAYSLIKNNLIC